MKDSQKRKKKESNTPRPAAGGGGGPDLRFWRSEISIAKEFLSGGTMTGMTGRGGKAIFCMT